MSRTILAAALATSIITTTPSGLFEPLWHFLSLPWDDSQPVPKNGCGFDPWGRCAPAPQPQSDSNSGFDSIGTSSGGS